MSVDIDVVSSLPFFDGLPAWVVERLAQAAEEVHRAPGDFVVRQHDEARAVFFLLSGRLQFLLRFEGVDDLLVGATDERGAPISWSVFRAPYRNTASVRCDGPCHLLEVPAAAFADVFVRDAHVHVDILTRVASVAAERLARSRDVLVMAPGYRSPEGESP